MYKRLNVFYQPLKYKDPETGKEIDLNEKYAGFRPSDPINYWPYILQGLILFPIRAILSFLTCFFLLVHLKIIKYFHKHTDTDPKEHEMIVNATKFWGGWFLKVNLIFLTKKDVSYEEVYKKYLGDDYNFKEDKFSLIICNHLGYYDVIANMALNGSGFMAMTEMRNAPIGGDIAYQIGSIFVNRENPKNREESIHKLLQRQKDFYEGKNLYNIVIFPEGTATNNVYLTKFKKGAFLSLLPLKPIIIKLPKNAKCNLCSGVTHLFFHVLRSFCYFTNRLYYTELPIIKPTDFMFEKYKNLGKEKWEIYMNVVYQMYLELGDFKETDIGLRDKNEYYDALETGIYRNIKCIQN
jgi:1-acyl-sn-glycerol-3-phosphate acyltransferase